MQPAERRGPDGLLAVKTQLDWKELWKKGENGLGLIMLSLLWWGVQYRVNGVGEASWGSAVSDATWVIEKIVADVEEDSAQGLTLPKARRRGVHTAQTGSVPEVRSTRAAKRKAEQQDERPKRM